VGVGVGVCGFVVVVVVVVVGGGEEENLQIGQANNAERDG
jgi:hypothetical protein